MSRVKSAENKKKPPRVAAGPEAPGFARSMGENLGRIARAVLPLILILSGGASVSWLLWRPLHANAQLTDSEGGASVRGRLNDRTLQLAVLQKPRPQWIKKEDYDETAKLTLVAQNHSVFEPSLSRTVAQRLAASPWVERVRSVRLRYPAQIDIDIDWRKPEARIDNSFMVVDRFGYVLNVLADSREVSDVPKIAGVTPGHTEIGKQVTDPDIQDALKLLTCVRETLNSSTGRLKVAQLQRDPSRTWRVITDRGPAINWGFFTDDPPIDEPRTNEKLAKLKTRLSESGDPSQLEYISVYTFQAPVKPRDASAAAPSTSRAMAATVRHP